MAKSARLIRGYLLGATRVPSGVAERLARKAGSGSTKRRATYQAGPHAHLSVTVSRRRRRAVAAIATSPSIVIQPIANQASALTTYVRAPYPG